MDKIHAAVYCGTKNLYEGMIASAKSLLIHSNVDQIYFIIEDSIFPYEVPLKTKIISVKDQTYFKNISPNYTSSAALMTLMRAALSKIFPQLDTILSLDVDTIVNKNISDIWNIPLDNYYFAAVREPHKSDNNKIYVNTGVTLFNLKKLRTDKKDDEIIEALNTQDYEFKEQDCYNELCKNHILLLDPSYNASLWTDPTDDCKILHYATLQNWQHLPIVQYYRNLHVSQFNVSDPYTNEQLPDAPHPNYYLQHPII